VGPEERVVCLGSKISEIHIKFYPRNLLKDPYNLEDIKGNVDGNLRK
jgi:hypothetical protein